MGTFKAPGPDGFQPFFYKSYWDLVGTDVVKLVRDAFQKGFCEDSLVDTLLVLIPKVDVPVKPKDFRPISLCNVSYKIITKVIVNRVRPLMEKLIGPLQSSFIPGRSTSDNAIVVQEVLHYMHTSKAKEGCIAFKIDLEKAYDRVCWDFLEQTLNDFKFPSALIQLIMWCVRSSNLALMWNGSRMANFKPTRGLRQGDPLSPYLFTLCMEKLSILISQKVADHSWKPIRVSRGGPPISHLLFADDILLFCKAKDNQVRNLMNTLNVFCSASGLSVNYAKSKAFCSKGVPESKKMSLTGLTNIRFTRHLDKYLGFQLIQGRPKKQDFLAIIDRIQGKLASWKSNMLSRAGRITLVKSVLSSIPTYTMQIYKLPTSISHSIDKITRGFIWGKAENRKGMHLVSWSKLVQPKQAGGLAIRDTQRNNLAFLGKLAWTVLSDPPKLWVQIMKSKYLRNECLYNAKKHKVASPTWKAIMLAWEQLKHGFSFKLGRGNTSIWYYPWSKQGSVCDEVSYVNYLDVDTTFADLWIDGNWCFDMLRTVIPPHFKELIQNFYFNPTVDLDDKWNWDGNGNGIYSVRSGYWWLHARSVTTTPNSNWNWVWKAKVTERIRFFLWLCLHDSVPTYATLASRGCEVQAICPRCNSHPESIIHCIRDCTVVMALWRNLGFTSNLFFHQDKEDWLRYWTLKNAEFPTVCWWIWKWRNNLIHGHEKWSAYKIRILIASDCSLTTAPGMFNRFQSSVWLKPPEGVVKLNVDGSVLPGSLAAGAGGVFRGEDGSWLFGFAMDLHTSDVLLTEIWSIWKGLMLAWERGYRNLIVESDSLDAVSIISDPYPPQLYTQMVEEIKRILQRDWSVSLLQIHRDANSIADWCANKGRRDAITSSWDEPPEELEALLVYEAASISYVL